MSAANERLKALPSRLSIALFLPLVLLLVVGGLLFVVLSRASRDAEWLRQEDETIALIFELEKRILDQETATRGFLLTGEPQFLEPFAGRDPFDLFRELERMLGADASQRAMLEEAHGSYSDWMRLTGDIRARHPQPDATGIPALLQRKAVMDATREHLQDLLNATRAERRDRAQAARDGTRNAVLLLIGLLGISALVLGVASRKQLRDIVRDYDSLLDAEARAREGLEVAAFVRSRHLALSTAVQGELDEAELGAAALRCLVPAVGAALGAFYLVEQGRCRRTAEHGFPPSVEAPREFALGSGLVGQAARDARNVSLTEVPEGYLRVESALGSGKVAQLALICAMADGRVFGVLELGFLKRVEGRVETLLEQVSETLGITLRALEHRSRLAQLLAETQSQAEELQTQHEEMAATNEELEEQHRSLEDASQRLELQQIELEQTNHSLSEQAALLRKQNDELLDAQARLAERASQIAEANRYKSEFLANMSHELRTPLNSSLILAKLLAENPDENLTPEQVKFAQTIYSAGNDLLGLINDVLDLSQIEAGQMQIHPSRTPLDAVTRPLVESFDPVARERNLRFEIATDGAPPELFTDLKRLQQILKNLLANAFKFTEQGSVSLRVRSAGEGRVEFRVADTGIGIPADRLAAIFEAFRQADGTTNRKYGGTGLGLTISRDLARRLGGDIQVVSTPGEGSAFTLSLPLESPVEPSQPNPTPPSEPPASAQAVKAPSSSRRPELPERPPRPRDSRLVLVIEDDQRFAEVLVRGAQEAGFSAIVAHTADDGLALAGSELPDAILLDVNLPDHTGLSVLDRLKRSAGLRHIPVHIVSVGDYAPTALAMGAVGYLKKPIEPADLARVFRELELRFARQTQRVLVVEDDPAQRDAIRALLSGERVETVTLGTVSEALRELKQGTFDCIVTDLTLPDASGYDLLERLATDATYPFPPVVVYTGRSLTPTEEQRLRRYSDAIVVKGARSPERLLDEVTLFLHQVESELPPERQRMLRQARHREAALEGRRVLVVEDDVRNVFALTSVLEPKGVRVEVARNGLEALEFLDRSPGVDLVLMDIMMPEMDGLTAIREIRKRPSMARLPIIALTAKAMRDDQEKSIAAGANDHAPKPVDVEVLLSLIRVWLPR